MSPSYLEEKQTTKGLKLDRFKTLISNREYQSKKQSETLATGGVQGLQQTTNDLKDKKPKVNDMSLKELDKSKEFKMFHKQLLNVTTFDPEIGHLLMIMDHICHSESSTIQVLKIKRE
jgi:hypothetical protein